MPLPDLPVVSAGPAAADERSDAARNRRLLLDAAAELVAEQGAPTVTMDAVARRAGVGKGTVFRRFGSRAGLMQALLDHTERDLQAGYISGPPPLGPGAPPVERLVAFGRAMLGQVETHGEVLCAAVALVKGARYEAAPYLASVTHVTALLRAEGHTENLRLLADTLLAPLDAALVLHQMRTLNLPLEQIAERWETTARRLMPISRAP